MDIQYVEQPNMDQNRQKIMVRVSFQCMVGNIILAMFKLFAGIVGRSGAMVSDAVHSASDVLGSLVVIIGAKFSGRESNKDFQYGHERLESVAAILLAIILAVAGVAIGFGGVKNIFVVAGGGTIEIPEAIALVAAVVSILVKEAMFWYVRGTASKIGGSVSLMAEAWHHRSDALSSVGSFVGILGAILKYPVLDPIASVIISALILKVAVAIFIEAVSKMVDRACDDETIEQMRELVLADTSVKSIDQFRTRMFGERIYVDIEVSMDGTLTLHESHAHAQSIHDAIERDFRKVKHCMIHVNPAAAADES